MEEIENLKKELAGVQEMLGFVLVQIGKPVVIPKALIQQGVPEGAQIEILEDKANECFIFRIVMEETNDDGES